MSIYLETTAIGASRAAQRRDIAIVIDVLRASSTIVTALSNGAREVIPVLTLAQARALANRQAHSILGGERRGIKPKGFDLGNSPREYLGEVVKNKTVILTTTSGTKALTRAKGAKMILVGALLNGEKVAEAAHNVAACNHTDISLVASGKRGELSFEDLLCAGQISYHLAKKGMVPDDGCEMVALAWEAAMTNPARAIWRSHHAQYLKTIGFGEDVEFCARTNASGVVPVLRGRALVPLNRR